MCMWTLDGFAVEKLMGAADVRVDVTKPIVYLTGHKGSGKSSAIAGISAAITGDALGPDGKPLKIAELKNPAWDHGAGEVTFGDGEEAFTVRREFKSSTTVIINGERIGTIGEADAMIENVLGVSQEQMLWLMGGDPLIHAKPREQAAILVRTLGVDLSYDGLIERLNEQGGTAEPVLAAASGASGWDLLSRAKALAEDARLGASRDLDDAKGRARTTEEAMDAALRAARCGDLSSLERKRRSLKRDLEDARARQIRLEEQQRERETMLRAVESAREARDEAEAEVAALREKLDGLDERRQAREAERAELQSAVDEAQKQLEQVRAVMEEREDALASAKTRLAAARDTARDAGAACQVTDHEVERLREERAEACATCECPDCGAEVALVDDVLVDASEAPGSEITDDMIAEAVERAAEARDAMDKANEAVDVWEERVSEAESSVEEQRAVVRRDTQALDDAQQALEEKPELPDAESVRGQLEAAAKASDRATRQLEEAEADLPDEVNEEAIQAAREDAQDAQEALEALDAATTAVGEHNEALEAREAAKEKHSDLDALVDRLHEITREVAEEIVEPIADSLGAMLGETVVFDAKEGLGVETPLPGNETHVRPLGGLSGGERLQARAALQGVLASALGVGLAVVDEFGALDTKSARQTLDIMRRVAEETGLVWVVASTQEPPAGIFDVQVVELEGGYTISEEAEVAEEVPAAK